MAYGAWFQEIVVRGYRVYLPGLGVPCIGPVNASCDFLTGPTSLAQLKVGRINGDDPIPGTISTSSVSIGTGSKVFTIDLSITAFGSNDFVKLASISQPTNFVGGTISSLVDTTLTITVPTGSACFTAGGSSSPCTGGSGSYSDWQLIEHSPNGWFQTGGRTRQRTSDGIGWDFRGSKFVYTMDGPSPITLSQSYFDACALSNADVNAPLLNIQTGAPVSNISADGCGYTGRLTSMIGGGVPSIFEFNKIIRAPLDIFNPVSSASVSSLAIRYNYMQSVCTTALSFGLHADGMQTVNWDNTNIEGYNNVIAIQCMGSNPSTVSAVINWGPVATFNGDIYFHDSIFIGGGFSVFAGDPGCTVCTGTIRFVNIYISNPVFQSDAFGNQGFITPNQAAWPNLSVPSVQSAGVNAGPLTMRWNNKGVVTTVTHIP